ncbi:hypothetical protein ABFB09_04135 [Dehalogenimonas sp. THU2]|uniref:hypothetical protein n=1 Tax=Dehalogenimonas sp. THU2 TaxID=3151121 RepID=UPI0032185E0C
MAVVGVGVVLVVVASMVPFLFFLGVAGIIMIIWGVISSLKWMWQHDIDDSAAKN